MAHMAVPLKILSLADAGKSSTAQTRWRQISSSNYAILNLRFTQIPGPLTTTLKKEKKRQEKDSCHFYLSPT
jgi:hypothetical protein